MNQPQLVTLIDADAQGLATLTYAFERAGFSVAGTSDMGMAAALVHGTAARLAVISLRAPEEASLAVIADLRKGTEGADLPVLALGPAGLRAAALQAGAFDYLPAPLFLRDAIAFSRLLLLMPAPAATATSRSAMASMPASPPATAMMTDREDPPEILNGSLDEFHGLYFLIRAMGEAGRSGVLQLARGKRKGEVKFFEGVVTSAQVRALQAFPALHQLLLWRGAAFSLKLRTVPKRAQFSASGAEILEECERFLRDVTHAAKQVGSLSTVFAHDSRQGGARAAEIPQEVAPVARLFDGVRTLGEVIEDSPFRIFDTLRVVKRLVDSQALLARAAGAPTVAMVREAVGSQPQPGSAAPPRARVRTASQGGIPRAPAPPQSPDTPPGAAVAVEVAGDARRDTSAERRKGVRRSPMPFEKPAAKPAPAPIPLVTRKSPSGGFAMGELRSGKPTRPTPRRGTAGGQREPTVQVNQDAGPRSLDHLVRARPANAVPVAAPVAVAPVSARQPVAHPRPAAGKGSVKTPAIKTPAAGGAPFNALEADFFAREADLYKSESRDSFEDLEHGGATAPAGLVRKVDGVAPADVDSAATVEGEVRSRSNGDGGNNDNETR